MSPSVLTPSHGLVEITAQGRMEVPNLPTVGAEVPHVKSHSSHSVLLPTQTSASPAASEQQSRLCGHPEHVAECRSSDQFKRR